MFKSKINELDVNLVVARNATTIIQFEKLNILRYTSLNILRKVSRRKYGSLCNK